MKTSTVNVIQCNSGIIDEIQSFVDDAEGNKEAECLFTRILNEQEDNLSYQDIINYLDDGVYQFGTYSVFLTHSY